MPSAGQRAYNTTWRATFAVVRDPLEPLPSVPSFLEKVQNSIVSCLSDAPAQRVWGRSLRGANLKQSGDTMPRDRQASCRSWSVSPATTPYKDSNVKRGRSRLRTRTGLLLAATIKAGWARGKVHGPLLSHPGPNSTGNSEPALVQHLIPIGHELVRCEQCAVSRGFKDPGL